jgi:prevent-host-death family protein
MCFDELTAKTITQRELRNDNAKVIEGVAAGESFIVTRNGVPVAEIRPFHQRLRTWNRARRCQRAYATPRSSSTGTPTEAAAFAEAVAVRAITLDDLAGRPHLAACVFEGARPPLSARRRDSTGP